MKKTIIISAILSLALLSCSQDNLFEQEAKLVTLSAAMPIPNNIDGSRVAIGNKGTDCVWAINWQEGDIIKVWDPNSTAKKPGGNPQKTDNTFDFTLQGEGGTSSGSFTGKIPEGANAKYAIYAAKGWGEKQHFVINIIPQFKASEYANNMICAGKVEGDNISFYHCMSVLKLVFKGLKKEDNQDKSKGPFDRSIKITTGDAKCAGQFKITEGDINSDKPTLIAHGPDNKQSSQIIVHNLMDESNDNNVTVYIPFLPGEYKTFNIDLGIVKWEKSSTNANGEEQYKLVAYVDGTKHKQFKSTDVKLEMGKMYTVELQGN